MMLKFFWHTAPIQLSHQVGKEISTPPNTFEQRPASITVGTKKIYEVCDEVGLSIPAYPSQIPPHHRWLANCFDLQ